MLMANTSCYIVDYSVDYDKGADFLVNTFNSYHDRCISKCSHLNNKGNAKRKNATVLYAYHYIT